MILQHALRIHSLPFLNRPQHRLKPPEAWLALKLVLSAFHAPDLEILPSKEVALFLRVACRLQSLARNGRCSIN